MWVSNGFDPSQRLLSDVTSDEPRALASHRKLAQQWHPDNFATGDDKEKKKSEAMFIDIAAAKEVLSDPGRSLGAGRGRWLADGTC